MPPQRASLRAALALLALLALLPAAALDNGVGLTPPMGFTTWLSFDFAVSDAKIRHVADQMVALGLRDAGYDLLWLDDGWPSCAVFEADGGCRTPAQRAANGSVVPDAQKFPYGLPATIAYLHSLKIKMGIYTDPHKTTCGGYTGALDYEAVDAQTFAAWGVDAVKMDAGCRDDTSIHDGTMLASLARMRDALNATGRRILLYVDDGNPSSGPKVYNPNRRGWANSSFMLSHFATTFSEDALSWGPSLANMVKIWYDRYDSWTSLMDNVNQQVGVEWWQRPGFFTNTDMITAGTGGLTAGETRAELSLYAALGAPLLLCCNLSRLEGDNETLSLLLNPELIAADQDPDCVQGTRISPVGYGGIKDERWAGSLWVRPLADGSFLAALVNSDPSTARTLSVVWGQTPDGSDGDLYPAGPFKRARVRDVLARADVGELEDLFAAVVLPHDARLLRITPV